MKHYVFLSILWPIFLSFLFFSCKKNSNTARPPCESQAIEIAVDTSFLSTPLVIPTQLIEDKLNRAIRQDILHDDDFNNKKKNGKRDNFKLKISRLGDIQVVWKDNVAKYQVPLLVLVERQIVPKKMLRLPKSLALKTEFSLRVEFETVLDIGENWKLLPRTRFRSFSWLSEVKVLGGLIDIKKMVERRMLKQMSQVQENMDSAIRANVNLDRTILKLWKNIQKPIRINKKEELVWLKVKPIRFEMGTITTKNGNLLIQGRLSATTETLLGDKPVHTIDSTLPPLVKRRTLPDEAYIYMLSEIPFSEINEIAARKIAGKTFEVAGHKIRVKTAKVWGCSPNLVLHLAVWGDAKGDIYFHGAPKYEADSQRIVIQNFDFEVKTQEFLLGSADWLLHDTFKEQVRNALSLELSEQIVKIPTKIMEGIERGNAGKKMDFTIRHWDFQPQKIWVRPNDIALLIIVNAKAQIELEQI